ncbi:hypothetical protein OIU85_002023 [Salix viminalis]|uniref:laccase n=1 Tax=Salix viminalis TaxID=40686 RepID=A0A9Q0VMI2_SALVM|nr:hypothetical protein OIU85_002023 [Salix viminalis]
MGASVLPPPHGIRQLRSGWADGPAYITQCPIQTGQSYVYNYTILGQRGTLWWHAHISWLRSTVYGPIIILPKPAGIDQYPFAKPYKEVPIIFGEWFNVDTEAVISQALQTGGGPNVSDAYTINGLPGPLYNCSANDTFKLKVKPGKTYMLRIINAALNDELFFSIANHSVITVDVDAVYNMKRPKPFTQATSLLKIFHSFRPTLPPLNDTAFAANFTRKLRSLASAQFPAKGPNGTKFAASVNNVSFSMPTTALLQTHFFGKSNGVYSPDFPITPTSPFNYTGNPPNNTMVFGNFDPNKDPAKFNLVDPVERNTVGVPSGGWAAIRGMVHALPFGGPYKLGVEDGLGCLGWKASQPEVDSTTS